MCGMIAQQQNGATIVLEHRFYGLSNPYNDLSVASLGVHTIQQAVDDLVYFAKNVQLSMPNGSSVGPSEAPWILVGGSYAGALVSWTMFNQPGVFWAGYASSAVVQAISDFWQYFEPIRENMPANCSADIEAVISHVDSVLNGTDQTAIQVLKSNWGLGEMTHNDDFAAALRENLFDWQSLQPDSGAGSMFTEFCDALEVSNGAIAPAAGFGLSHALTAWGSFWNTTYLTYICGGGDPVSCLGTYDANSSYYTNLQIENPDRSWFWTLCTELGFFEDGPPTGRPAIVSRQITPSWTTRQCQEMFPSAFVSAFTSPGVNQTNNLFGGWNVDQSRLFFATATRDPWRDATVSAENITVSTSAVGQQVMMSDGFHCSDLLAEEGLVDASIKNVQTQALKNMATWLAQWS